MDNTLNKHNINTKINLKRIYLKEKKELKNLLLNINIKNVNDFINNKKQLNKIFGESKIIDIEKQIEYIKALKNKMKDLNFDFDTNYYTTLLTNDLVNKYNLILKFNIDKNDKFYIIRQINHDKIIGIVLFNEIIKEAWADELFATKELLLYMIYKIEYLNIRIN